MNPNNYLKQKERGLKRKIELIKYKGGKCEICGYDKNIAVFEFHHVDPTKKFFALDLRHLSNTTIDKIKEEADKCILVCANCHREIHNPNLNKKDVENYISNSSTNNIRTFGTKHKLSICENCGKEYKYVKGKRFCSDECRESFKKYPSYEEVILKYNELLSWDKVAKYFNLTRKIISGIRKNKKN